MPSRFVFASLIVTPGFRRATTRRKPAPRSVRRGSPKRSQAGQAASGFNARGSNDSGRAGHACPRFGSPARPDVVCTTRHRSTAASASSGTPRPTTTATWPTAPVCGPTRPPGNSALAAGSETSSITRIWPPSSACRPAPVGRAGMRRSTRSRKPPRFDCLTVCCHSKPVHWPSRSRPAWNARRAGGT